MARLDDFRPYVVPLAPGLPEPVIDRAIVDAAIQFCRDTRVLQRELDPLRVRTGRGLYELEALDGLRPFAVVRATTDGGTPGRVLEPLLPNARGPVSGPTTHFREVPGDALELVPPPTHNLVVTVRAAVAPLPRATQLPDELYHDWRESIGAGAAVRLLLVYGDPRQAATAEQVYQRGVQQARARSTVGAMRARLRTRPQA